jgi:UDP-4-amino-4,6-dideoxy-N-acetyl-beta-L-altrosamine transaminase
MKANYIPYARQSITQEDIEAVEDILRSEWLTTGPAIEAFEHNVTHYCNVRFAVAVNSATSALHLAYLAAGLGPGDILWATPNTFVATANAALYCGASVDFVDIDPNTYNMSVECLANKLSLAKAQQKLPKIVVPVHFAGQPCQMKEIWSLAEEYGFTVIEDASHAIGASYLDNKIGSCRYSHMTVFSFHPVKIITTGEGGMVVTNDAVLHKRLSRLRSHGITRDSAEMIGDSHGDWYYQQVELGYNFRMTDIQAALGSSQLTRIDTFVARRREIATRYSQELFNSAVILPYQQADGASSWHLYVIGVDAAKSTRSRRQVFNELRTAGIGVNVHYIPVHTQPYYRQRFAFTSDSFPNSLAYYNTCLSLPMYYELSDSDQQFVIHCLKEAIR